MKRHLPVHRDCRLFKRDATSVDRCPFSHYSFMLNEKDIQLNCIFMFIANLEITHKQYSDFPISVYYFKHEILTTCKREIFMKHFLTTSSFMHCSFNKTCGNAEKVQITRDLSSCKLKAFWHSK